MDKKEQEKLLTEIMEADTKDGLYEPTVSKMETTQTAVEWLEQQLKSTYMIEGKLPLAYTFELLRKAKQIENEQIEKAIDGALIAYGIIKTK